MEKKYKIKYLPLFYEDLDKCETIAEQKLKKVSHFLISVV